MDLTIVVVNWNAGEFLRRCLATLSQSAFGQGERSAEVIVVDNASTDASVEMIRQEHPQVTLLCNRENVGFARANNQALRIARGDYVLLLNPDTEVQPGAMDALLEFMGSHPRVGAAGPRLVDQAGQVQPSCYRLPSLFGEFWRLFHLEPLHNVAGYPMESWSRTVPRAVEVIQGACLMVRRRALEETGMLDEDYFMYTEEVDLCHRLRERRWGVFWVPQAEVIHHGGQSTRQNQTAMFLHLYRSKVLYFRKHHGWPAVQAYKVILLAASLVRVLWGQVGRLRTKPAGSFELSLSHNYWTLLRTLPSL